ncbi:MAG TPA: type II secretion system minor pseudopilin GspH [Steroidobacteraceae bacterium]|nr:type II secretion system minor pseudopilin GspH [Steroidobacteraceae bacterium]
MARRSLSRAFTLLEILVVMLIIGIMATVVTVSVGALGKDREMEDTAERLWAILQQAREESELQGFDIGLRVGAQSYDFLRFDARQQAWLPVIDDDLLYPRDLPEGLRMRLWLEGREAVLAAHPASAAEEEEIPPEEVTTKASDDPAGDVDETTIADEPDKKKEVPPQIMVLASGDVNAFEVQFERDGTTVRWRLLSNPDSTLTVEEMDVP